MVKAQNDDGIVFDHEGDGDPSLEAGNPEARPNIVAPTPSQGRSLKTEAVFFQTLDICHRDVGSGPLCDPVEYLQKIVPRLERKDDGATPHARSFFRA